MTADQDERMSMLGHLEELRWRVAKGAAAIFLGAILAYFYRVAILDLLKAPFTDTFPGNDLRTIRPTEEFASAMRISFFGGFVVASPVVMWQTWAFVAPGLTGRERRWAIPTVSALVALFLGGVAFAYAILPRSLLFLNDILSVEAAWTVSEYLLFVVRFLVVFGLTFEFPLFLFAAGAVGLVRSEQLFAGRRWAILVITIVAAAATPTGDPFTMLYLAVPLYLMYEVTAWLIKYVLKK